jgi:antitoxin component of MazEF toxin-antitoxin module
MVAEKKDEKVGKDVRRLFKLGGSLVITLPNEYVKRRSLKEGDLVEIYFDDIVYMRPVNVDEFIEKIRKVKELLE